MKILLQLIVILVKLAPLLASLLTRLVPSPKQKLCSRVDPTHSPKNGEFTVNKHIDRALKAKRDGHCAERLANENASSVDTNDVGSVAVDDNGLYKSDGFRRD